MASNKFYATIGRSKDGKTKTKVRLKENQHKVLLAIAMDPKFQAQGGHLLTPVHQMGYNDWSKIASELKIGNRVGFTIISRGDTDLFTLCNKATLKEVKTAEKVYREKTFN